MRKKENYVKMNWCKEIKKIDGKKEKRRENNFT